jgi:hypothetical protein
MTDNDMMAHNYARQTVLECFRFTVLKLPNLGVDSIVDPYFLPASSFIESH